MPKGENKMLSIKIKEWFFNKTSDNANRYNTFVDFERNESGMRKIENGYVTVFTREVISETEKAIKVNLESGAVVGSCKGWTTWIPKSVISEVAPI